VTVLAALRGERVMDRRRRVPRGSRVKIRTAAARVIEMATKSLLKLGHGGGGVDDGVSEEGDCDSAGSVGSVSIAPLTIAETRQ
jgi:hypothetical protein